MNRLPGWFIVVNLIALLAAPQALGSIYAEIWAGIGAAWNAMGLF